ncbi:hypothetical protein AAKU67_003156 [Oxalobacteraceae bacterium GrIS 2.11]
MGAPKSFIHNLFRIKKLNLPAATYKLELRIQATQRVWVAYRYITLVPMPYLKHVEFKSEIIGDQYRLCAGKGHSPQNPNVSSPNIAVRRD